MNYFAIEKAEKLKRKDGVEFQEKYLPGITIDLAARIELIPLAIEADPDYISLSSVQVPGFNKDELVFDGDINE